MRSTFLLLPLLLGAGCRLDPLVEDDPGASLTIVPAGEEVPRVDADPELVHRIGVYDGLDDNALMMAEGVVPRITGWADGVQVSYWSFGNAPRFAANVYVFVDGGGLRVDHPMLLDSLPGDPTYSAIRRIQYVTVTGAWDGEQFPTVRAMEDGIDLGLLLDPVPAGTWFDAPVVPPGTRLDVGEDQPPAEPDEAFAAGYRVDLFTFDEDPRSVQPLRSGLAPTWQVATLREQGGVSFKPGPVFSKPLPVAPPTDMANYTPLWTVVEVQLAPGVLAADLHADADLFTRGMTGQISGLTANVASINVTTTIKNWPMQFDEGVKP